MEVRGGRIARLEPWAGLAPDGALEVDGWIAPGFVDLQVNGFAGQDFADPAADLALASRRLAEHGVTAFLPTLTSAPLERYLAVLARLGAPLPAAQSLGVHLEGPYLHPRYRGAHPARWLRLPDRAELQRLLSAGPVRMLTLAPELPGALEAIPLLVGSGVVVSLGHSGATYEQATPALAAGARAGTHLFNAMRPFHHREPGLAGALLAEDRATVGVIVDGVHLHPAVVRLAYRLTGPGRMALVTDATAAADMPEGDYILGEARVHAHGGEARLADGTRAGSVLSMDQAVRQAVAFAECSPREAVAMATATPAALLGLRDRGVLAAGARADLVVLSRSLAVQRTYVGGRLVVPPHRPPEGR